MSTRLPPSKRPERQGMTTEKRLAYIGNMLACVGRTREQIHGMWEKCISGIANPGFRQAVKDGQVEDLMDAAAVFYLVIVNDHIIGDSPKWHAAIDSGIDDALSGNRIGLVPYKGKFVHGEDASTA